MKHNRIKSCLATAILLGCTSCSVKEDRSVCPCFLTVDLSTVLDAESTSPSLWNKGLDLLLISGGNPFVHDRISYEEALYKYEYLVPRTDNGVIGILGADNGVIDGDRMLLPEGSQSDALYVSSEMVPCQGETAFSSLKMFKQFSKVEITGLQSFDFVKEVSAGSSGLDLMTRSALPGRFRYILECDEDGVCTFLLPRQADDRVIILLYGKDGKLDNSIPLGQYLSASGFDWNAENLADVSVNVDRTMAFINITIGGWTHTVDFTYTL